MGAGSSRELFQEAVRKLSTEEIQASDTLWDGLWKSPVTGQDIYELIRPSDVRKITTTCPGNVQILLSQSIIQIFQVVETPYPVYFDQALTCIRMLTRVLPIFLEDGADILRSQSQGLKFDVLFNVHFELRQPLPTHLSPPLCC